MDDQIESPLFRRRSAKAGLVRRLAREGRNSSEAEEVIADLDVERVYLFDSTGRQVAIFEGDSERVVVPLTRRERQRVRDGVFLHNHPVGRSLAPEHPHFGFASFSPADVIRSKEWNVELAIVVTPRWRFTLERPAAGWTAAFGRDFEDLLLSLWTVITERDEWGVDDADSRTERRLTRADRVAEVFAVEIGATYRREQR